MDADTIEYPSRVTETSPNNASSNGLVSSLRVASGNAVLFGFTVLNTKAASQFIQLFDTIELPADTAVPTFVVSINASTDRSWLWIPGRRFRRGIWVCNSSTAATKTIGSADCFFDCQWL